MSDILLAFRISVTLLTFVPDVRHSSVYVAATYFWLDYCSQHSILISLAYQMLSIMDQLRFRRVYCTSPSLGTPGALASCVLGVTWYPYHQIRQFYVFLEALLCLLWALSGTLVWRVLGVLWSFLFAHSGRSLARFPDSIILRKIFFSGIFWWPHEPIDTGILVWTRCFSSPISLIFLGRTAWPDQVTCITQKAWLSWRCGLFILSDRIQMSEVLSKSCPCSLWMEAVASPFIARHCCSRRDKVSVLEMRVYHPYYLMLLTCGLVSDKSLLLPSKNLLVVVVKDISECIL